MTRATHVAVAVLALLAFAALPAIVLAHAELTSSSPADGERLEVPPPEVILVFDSELLPDGTGFVVTDADGDTVGKGAQDLTVADRNEIRGAVGATGPGTFTIAWTAVGADGHAESGRLSFTVGRAASGTSPDTAMATDETNSASPIGGLLLLVATAAVWLRRSVAAR